MDGDYVGSKQERRDKKRKHSVMDLFQSNNKKRQRTDSEKSLKKEEALISEDETKSEPPELTPAIAYESGTEVLKGFETSKPKVKTYAKKKKKEAFKIDTDNEEEVGPEWVDGEPQGIESFIVDGNEGKKESLRRKYLDSHTREIIVTRQLFYFSCRTAPIYHRGR